MVVLDEDLPRAQQILADLKAHGTGVDWSQVDIEEPTEGEAPAAEA